MAFSIGKIGVIGAGQMGNGIAQVLALSGYRVTMVDVKPEFVQKGLATVQASLGKFAEKGKIKEADKVAALERLGPSPIHRLSFRGVGPDGADEGDA